MTTILLKISTMAKIYSKPLKWSKYTKNLQDGQNTHENIHNDWNRLKPLK